MSERKHPSTRQNRVTTNDIVLSGDAESRINPLAPRGLRPAAREAWRMFATSPIAQLVEPDSDLTALRRWAYCISERDRLAPTLRANPLVPGSAGQLVANPLAAMVRDLSAEIAGYEQKFGMTPSARLKLGVVFGQATLAMRDVANHDDEVETVVIEEDDLFAGLRRTPMDD